MSEELSTLNRPVDAKPIYLKAFPNITFGEPHGLICRFPKLPVLIQGFINALVSNEWPNQTFDNLLSQ